MTNVAMKDLYAATGQFGDSEASKEKAVNAYLDAGGKSIWLPTSEKNLLQLQATDATNKLDWAKHRAAIIRGRGEEAVRLIATPTTALSDDEKAERKSIQKSVTQYCTRWKQAVVAAEKARAGEVAKRTKKTLATYLTEQCTAMEKRIENAETPDIENVKPVLDAIRALRQAIKS